MSSLSVGRRCWMVVAAATLSLSMPAVRSLAQSNATVTVNAGSPLSTIPTYAFGINAAVWDGNLLDAQLPGLLQQAGVTMMRYPGGSTSDVYHWQTNSGTAGTGAYTNPNDNFDAFMGVVQSVGTGVMPIITVNYGSNAAGNAGGDPNEAAAWVKYANVTKGYGVKYWEIGNEIYGNGEYGAVWEEDLHPGHDPTTYGTNCVQFITAMKAQDPTIKVGVVLCTPGNWPDGLAPNWNTNVLAACGAKLDFVIVHWYPQGPGGESDSGLLATTSSIAGMVSTLKTEISTYCGANAPNVQILVTETNSVSSSPGKQSVSLVNGLFMADNYMDWLEHGVANIDWWCLHGGISTGNNNSASLYGSTMYGDYGILADATSGGGYSEPAAETPFPPYYALQMLTYLGTSGDTMVASTSNQTDLTVHAVKQSNGNLSLLYVNKNPTRTRYVATSVKGYTPASSATVYSYGIGSGAITAAGKTGYSGSFIQTVPPYSLVTVLLSANNTSSPTFTTKGTVSPSTLPAGSSAIITTKVNCTSGTLSNGTVDVQVFNPSGTSVYQTYFQDQNFTSGQQKTYTLNWTAPLTAGTYKLEIGVFNSTLTTDYYWSGIASLINVTPTGDSAQYNFENGAQGWASSGGMISGVATSSAQYFAGTHSLAVSFTGTKSDTQQVAVSSPATPAGKVVTFHVWIPSGSNISAIQPYVQEGASGGWAWTGNYQPIGSLQTNAWNTLTVTVPANAATPLFQLGVQFFTSAAWTGTCYVDSVGW